MIETIKSALSFFIFSFVFIINSFASTKEKEKVLVVYYNDSPPWYVSEKKEGLNTELVGFLNQDKNSPFEFFSEFLPRKRVDNYIEKQNEPMIIAWVNKKFFSDKVIEKFYWSEPLLTDSQFVISNKAAPIEYKNIESLVGKKFSAVLGTQYKIIELAIAKGQIVRFDSHRFMEAFNKVKNRELDFAIAENSLIQYHKKKSQNPFASNEVYISKNLFSPIYGRGIAIKKENYNLVKYVNRRVKNIKNNKKWNDILKKYGQSI